ncbi:MAG: hypothetical protein KF846_17085 [Cyclobacteriaceae bacterium]|nr:hypothetical protein [Cyclobacteriaceae bacterium]MBX2957883.1 hypothetical protein [Cyclobacteriaceae bacterium]
MKNILIPTTLKHDTLKAVRAVVKNVREDNIKIVLLMLSEMPDGITDLLFSSKSGAETSVKEQKVLDECRNFVAEFDQVSLQVHHQYGMSGPLLRNIMNHHTIGLTVLTPSYKNETGSIHKQAVKSLLNSKCPILHIPERVTELALDQAIYVDNSPSHISMEDIQHMLNKDFAIRVVSQAKLMEGQRTEDLTPELVETIEKNNINLLVETRKPERKGWGATKVVEQVSLAEKLGVPVLSLIDN